MTEELCDVKKEELQEEPIPTETLPSKKFSKTNIAILAAFFLIFLILHTRMNYTAGDFEVFADEPDTYESLFAWLKFRWDTWSSRLLVETVLSYITSSPPAVWVLLNCFIYTHMTYRIAKLVDGKNFSLTLAVTALLVLTYPFLEMREAGWMATTLNYLWPFYFFILFLGGMKKLYHRGRLHPLEYLLYAACLIFACNVEQMVVVALLSLMLMLYVFLRDKKNPLPLILYAGLAFASLYLALICPGNTARNIYETARQFWDFGNLDLLQRIQLGASLTFEYMFFKGCLPFLAFSSILSALVLTNPSATKFEKGLGLIPPAVSLILGCIPFAAREMAGIALPLGFSSGRYGFIELTNYPQVSAFLPFMVIGLVLAAILISMLAVMEDWREALLIYGIFISGCLTSMVLGFSSTAWFSRHRIHFFMNFALIICSLLLLKPTYLQREEVIGLKQWRADLRGGSFTDRVVSLVLPLCSLISLLVMYVDM